MSTFRATDAVLRAAFEAPLTVMCGAAWAAVSCGFAVYLGGKLYITPAGIRYLERTSL
jgi:hypothetical protein